MNEDTPRGQDQNSPDLGDPRCARVFDELGQLTPEFPESRLRAGFDRLVAAWEDGRSSAEAITPTRRTSTPWRIAAAVAVAALVLGLAEAGRRLTVMETAVRDLGSELVVARLNHQQFGDRLQAAAAAGNLAVNKPGVLAELVERAANDPSDHMRLAAIHALHGCVGSPDLAPAVSRLMRTADSPLVQIAVIDLAVHARAVNARHEIEDAASNATLDPAVRRAAEWALVQLRSSADLDPEGVATDL